MSWASVAGADQRLHHRHDRDHGGGCDQLRAVPLQLHQRRNRLRGQRVAGSPVLRRHPAWPRARSTPSPCRREISRATPRQLRRPPARPPTRRRRRRPSLITSRPATRRWRARSMAAFGNTATDNGVVQAITEVESGGKPSQPLQHSRAPLELQRHRRRGHDRGRQRLQRRFGRRRHVQLPVLAQWRHQLDDHVQRGFDQRRQPAVVRDSGRAGWFDPGAGGRQQSYGGRARHEHSVRRSPVHPGGQPVERPAGRQSVRDDCDSCFVEPDQPGLDRRRQRRNELSGRAFARWRERLDRGGHAGRSTASPSAIPALPRARPISIGSAPTTRSARRASPAPARPRRSRRQSASPRPGPGSRASRR